MNYIIGCDEVGLGAWAGPLMACAVAVPADWTGPPGLTDSKTFSKNKAAMLPIYNQLVGLPLALASMSVEGIDSMGLRPSLIATQTMVILELLRRFPGARVVVDGDVPLPELPRAELHVKGDAKFPAISAASIIAKVNRDFLMKQYHAQFPHYGWDTNAGYGGNSKHAAGLDKYGVTFLHRRSYGPIKERLGVTSAQRQMNLFEGT